MQQSRADRYSSKLKHFEPPIFSFRYQEIGQVVESCLSDENSGLSLCKTDNSDFKFQSSQSVWESLLKCFNTEIFLLPLLHRFWKLALLILSRYRTWVQHCNTLIEVSFLGQ